MIAQLWRLPPAVCTDIVEESGIRIAMRDGVELVMDRFYPQGGDGLPVILIRSPYGRGNLFHYVAVMLAERGFQVLLQSCRGTGGSDGILRPSFHEEQDGADTIDWVSCQPWYCGKLALMGASYSGQSPRSISKPISIPTL